MNDRSYLQEVLNTSKCIIIYMPGYGIVIEHYASINGCFLWHEANGLEVYSSKLCHFRETRPLTWLLGGRGDNCWCGSGRYAQSLCHVGSTCSLQVNRDDWASTRDWATCAAFHLIFSLAWKTKTKMLTVLFLSGSVCIWRGEEFCSIHMFCSSCC